MSEFLVRILYWSIFWIYYILYIIFRTRLEVNKMAVHKIKWKQSDYIKLGKAVSEYNKKLARLNNIEEKSYLPRNDRL